MGFNPFHLPARFSHKKTQPTLARTQTVEQNFGHRRRVALRGLCGVTTVMSVLGGIILGSASKVLATPVLNIYPLGWNVMGLDSNNTSVGPNQFLLGARVCNTGTSAARNVTATFLDDGGSSYLSVIGPGSPDPKVVSLTTDLPSGSANPDPRVNGGAFTTLPDNCFDFYFNLNVTRNSSAYSDLSVSSSRKPFRIQVTGQNTSGSSLGTLLTPTNRELYVEKLISQGRNAVLSFSGPSTVVQGQTVTYTVTGKTAPGGYQQLAFAPVLPTFFQLISSSIAYSSPSGSVSNSVYADGCGWENDATSTYYHNNLACDNPSITAGYTGDKVGDTFTATYKIKVLATGSGTLSNLIYDFSGSSYHYNSDLGTGVNSLSVTAISPSTGIDLAITKTPIGSFNKSLNATYNLTVTNVGGLTTTGTITVSDVIPNTLTYVSSLGSSDPNWSCSYTTSSKTLTCTSKTNVFLAPNSSLTIPVVVTPTQAGSVSNTATVSTQSDSVTGNNSSTAVVVVNDPTAVDVSIKKAVASVATTPIYNDTSITANPSANVIYRLTITGDGSKDVTGISVDDIIDSTVTTTNGTLTTLATSTTTPPSTGLGACRITDTGSGSGSNSCSLTITNNVLSGTVNLKKNAIIEIYIPGTIVSTASGSIPNIAYLVVPSSAYTDTNTANNNDSATINVNIPDLKIVKSHTGTFTQGGTGTYTLGVSNVGLAATTGQVTVTDTLPTGLTPQTVSGSGWTCDPITGQTVTCRRSDSLAAGASYPAITLTVVIASNASTSLTNTASIATGSGGDQNPANNTANDVTSIVQFPNLILVKRITEINSNSTVNPNDSTTLSSFVSVDTQDASLLWPTPKTTYLKGAVNGGTVKPNDLVEYTIYFLSNGSIDSKDVTICDLIPAGQTFATTGYNTAAGVTTPTTTTNKGIALALSNSSLPTVPTQYLTNAVDSDRGHFYAAGDASTPTACKKLDSAGTVLSQGQAANTNGAVVIDVVKTGDASPYDLLPPATTAGSPINSYGFIRFKANVNP
jgi:uncharacterized repeat protein (TIGR01451 family)